MDLIDSSIMISEDEERVPPPPTDADKWLVEKSSCMVNQGCDDVTTGFKIDTSSLLDVIPASEKEKHQ